MAEINHNVKKKSKVSQNPQTLNFKQSLQVLRRINRLKASAMKKKQQLSTQNLVDHVNREASSSCESSSPIAMNADCLPCGALSAATLSGQLIQR